MPRPRKKARVFKVPQNEMVSVTRVSLGDGHQVVTKMPLPVPSQDHTVKTVNTTPATAPTLPASLDDVASVNNTTESRPKQRYVSSVRLFLFRGLRHLFLFCHVLCFHFQVCNSSSFA